MSCGKPLIAMVYFVSFMVIMSFVFLNLFIAIILENFAIQNDAADSKVNQETFDLFNKHWLRFDPKGRAFISVF
jgi:voltage-dependent calcium channel